MPVFTIIDENETKLQRGRDVLRCMKEIHNGKVKRILRSRHTPYSWAVYFENENEMVKYLDLNVRKQLKDQKKLKVNKPPSYKDACSIIISRYNEFFTVRSALVGEALSIIGKATGFRLEDDYKVWSDFKKYLIEFETPEIADIVVEKGIYIKPFPILPFFLEKKKSYKVIQCTKCYSYDHDRSACEEPSFYCFICGAEGHKFDKCPDNPPKCKNCQGNHTAVAYKCPVRKSRLCSLKNSEQKQDNTLISRERGAYIKYFHFAYFFLDVGEELELDNFIQNYRIYKEETGETRNAAARQLFAIHATHKKTAHPADPPFRPTIMEIINSSVVVDKYFRIGYGSQVVLPEDEINKLQTPALFTCPSEIISQIESELRAEATTTKKKKNKKKNKKGQNASSETTPEGASDDEFKNSPDVSEGNGATAIAVASEETCSKKKKKNKKKKKGTAATTNEGNIQGTAAVVDETKEYPLERKRNWRYCFRFPRRPRPIYPPNYNIGDGPIRNYFAISDFPKEEIMEFPVPTLTQFPDLPKRTLLYN